MEMKVEEENKKSCPAKKWGILFFVLLLIFVSALAFVGYGFYYTYKQSEQTIASLQNLSNENKAQLSELKQNVTDLSSQLNEKVKSQNELISTLQQTVNGGKESWRLVQASYLVKLANDNLQFEQDVDAASRLLQAVDNDLINIEDANLLTIRRAVASDLESLRAVPKVDVNGIFTKLAAVNNQLDALPFFSKQAENTQAKPNSEPEVSWWKKQLLNTWKDLREIVVIRYNKSGNPPLIAPEQREFLLQNLHAKLDNASWALLHKNSQIYHASLEQETDWIKRNFVQDAEVTKAVLTSLEELKKENIQPNLPNINASIQAFHDYFNNSANVRNAS